MDCPRCQKELSAKDYEHLSVFSCTQCSGIWLTPPQLSKITTMREQFSAGEIQNTLKLAHTGIPDEASALACPVCDGAMEELNYDYSSGIILHSCPTGDGIWFDKDELDEAQIFMEHWDDEENKHIKEYIADLDQDKAELEAEEKKELSDEKAHVAAFSREHVLNRLFELFDMLKMDK